MNSLSKFARISATAGAVVWLLLLLTITSDSRETEIIHKVVFFGMLVIVPLGLSLVPIENERGFYRVVVLAQPVAAVPAIASFFFPAGLLAASLSSAWLILSIFIALFRVVRFKSRGLYPIAESSIDAGLLCDLQRKGADKPLESFAFNTDLIGGGRDQRENVCAFRIGGYGL